MYRRSTTRLITVVGLLLALLVLLDSGAARAYSSTQEQTITSAGQTMTFTFSSVPAPYSDAKVTVTVRGDFSSSTETADVSFEGISNPIGTNSGASPDCSTITTNTFTASELYVVNAADDGKIVITVKLSSGVSPTTCSSTPNYVRVNLSYASATASMSQVKYITSNGQKLTYAFNFSRVTNPTGRVRTATQVRGDFDSSGEYADLQRNGASNSCNPTYLRFCQSWESCTDGKCILERNNGGTGICQYPYPSRLIYSKGLMGTHVASDLSDGILTFTAQCSSGVNYLSGSSYPYCSSTTQYVLLSILYGKAPKGDLNLVGATVPSSGTIAGGNSQFYVTHSLNNATTTFFSTNTHTYIYYCPNASSSGCTQLGSHSITNDFSGGENYTSGNSAQLTIPASAVAGTRYIRFMADGGSVFSEENESNNERYYPITIAKPDLSTSNLTLDWGSTAGHGSTFKTKYQVVNANYTSKITSTFRAKFYYCDSQSTSSCTFLTYQDISSDFNSGYSTYFISPILTMPSVSQVGTRYIRVQIDSQNAIAEGNEGNNDSYKSITVATKPDLTTDNLSIPTGGSTAGAGSTFTVKYRAVNKTSTSKFTNTFRAKFYYCDTQGTSSCVELGYQDITTDFDSGEANYYTSSTLTMPARSQVGTRYIRVQIDSENAIAEGTETNNDTYLPITVTTKPDLTADTLSVASGSTAGHGSQFTLSYRLKNAGTSSKITTDFSVKFYLSDNSADPGEEIGSQTITTDINSGGNTVVTSPTLTMPASSVVGTRYIRVQVDSTNAVAESTETNNDSFRSISVSTKPDLTTDSLERDTGSVAGAGSTFTLKYRVVNKTNTSRFTTNFKVKFYYCESKSTSACTYLGFQDWATDFNSGHTVTVTTPTLTMPTNTSVGTRYIRFQVDSENAIAEGTETNNDSYLGIMPNAKPDLTADNLSIASGSTAGHGSKFRIGYRVVNASGTSKVTATFRAKFYYCESAGAGACTYLGFWDITNDLVAGGTVTLTSGELTMPAGCQVGTRHVRVQIDSEDAIDEKTETNNDSYKSITVATKPDLTVIHVNKGAGCTSASGCTFTLTYDVKNDTSTSKVTTNFEVKFYYCEAANTTSCTLLDTQAITADLDSGGTHSVTSPTMTIPGNCVYGSRYLRLEVDAAAAVDENDEANNNTYFGITIDQRPDLVVSDLSVSPTTIGQGGQATITYRIKNDGRSRSGAFKVRFYYSDDSTITTSDTYLNQEVQVSSLDVQAYHPSSSTGTVTVTIPAGATAGSTRYVGAIVDVENSVTESGEGNNTKSASFTVGKPDLVMHAWTTPTSITGKGSTVSITYQVKNAGLADAGAFRVGFYYADSSGMSGGSEMKYANFTSLAQGATQTSQSISFAAGPDVANGTRYLYYWIDNLSAVAESNETNNKGEKSFLVDGKPDLRVTAVGLTPSTVNPGGTATFSYRVCNYGVTRTLSAVKTRFYYSTDSSITTGDTYLNVEVSIPALNAGSCHPSAAGTTSQALTVPSTASPPGTSKYIGAVADTGGAVSESDEGNNGAGKSFVLGGPDLTMAAWSAPSTSEGYGKTVALTFQVKNSGSANAGAFRVQLYYGDGTSTSGLTSLGYKDFTSLNAGATQTQQSVTLTLPGNVLNGSRYLHYFIDSNGVVAENNESNNRAYRSLSITGKPDLVVTSVGVSPGTIVPGGTATVTYVVQNVGLARAASNHSLKLYYSDDSAITTSDTYLKYLTLGPLDAGAKDPASGTRSTAVTVPTSAPPGATRYLGAYADTAGAIPESNEGNNGAGKSFVVDGTDLVMNTWSAPSSAEGYGSSVKVEFAVRNNGGVAAGAFRVELYYGDTTSTTGLVSLGYIDFTSLAGNTTQAAQSKTVTLPASVLPGTRRLHYFIDSGTSVGETDEGNNRGHRALNITGKPDLVIQHVAASVTSVQPGGTISLTYRIQNNGKTRSTHSTVARFYLSTDSTIAATDTYLNVEATVPPMDAGGSHPAGGNGSVTVTIPATTTPGSYQVGPLADWNDALSEASEANNGSGTPLNVVQADLTMSSWSFNTTAAGKGSVLTISYEVKNQGTDPSGAFRVEFYYGDSTSTAGLVLLGYKDITSVPSGTTRTGSVVVSLPGSVLSGSRYLHYFIDAKAAVVESNEGNNRGYKGISITGKPNLKLTAFSVTPSTQSPGGALTVSYRLYNAGTTRAAGGFETWLYFSTDSTITTGDVYLNKKISVAGLDAGAYSPATQNGTESVTVPASASPGTRYIGAVVDKTGAIAESDEGDNLGSASFFVGGKPDLQISTWSAPSSATGSGSSVTVSFDVKNGGTAGSGPFKVGVYYGDSTSTTGLTFLGETSLGALAMGASSGSKSITVSLKDDVLYGSRYIHLHLDHPGDIDEISEANNRAYKALSISGKPDLQVSYTLASPATAKPGDTVNITWRVRNAGKSRVDQSFMTRFYLSTNSEITVSDTYLGKEVQVPGPLKAGAYYPANGNATQQVTLPNQLGSLYIGPLADYDGQVGEVSASNNYKAASISIVQPNLRMEAWSAPTPVSGYGSQLPIQFSVKNYGNADAGAFKVSFYYGDTTSTSNLVPLGHKDFSGLAKGVATASQTLTVTIPGSVLYGGGQLHFFIDSEGKVGESNETDNRSFRTLGISDKPDLQFSVASVSPAVIQPGGTGTITYRLLNGGKSRANKTFLTRFYLSTDSTISTGDTYLGKEVSIAAPLNAGATHPTSANGTVTFTLPTSAQPGATLYVGPLADTGGVILESLENNNYKALKITVGQPDLVLDTFTAPTEADGHGSTLTLQYKVKNAGGGDAGAFRVQFYYGDATSTTGLVSLGYKDYASLGAGASQSGSLSATLPASVLNGPRYLHYFVDSLGKVAESNEPNNRGTRALTIKGKPDLTVTVTTVSPAEIAPGAEATIAYRIQNIGKARATAFKTKLYFSTDSTIDTSDTALSSVISVSSLNAGAYYPANGNGTVKEKVPTSARPLTTAYIGPYADAEGAVAEGSETNNSNAASFKVVFGGVDKVVISPTTATIKAGGTVQFGVKAYDALGNEITTASFVWAVESGSGAVDQNGLFTAATKPGTSVVKVTSGGKTAKATVTVTADTVVRVAVTPSPATVMVDGKVAFNVKGYDKYDNEVPGLSFTWSVTAGGGTIDSTGNFTAGTKTGTFASTVLAKTGALEGRATVEVKPGATAKVVVDPATATLTKGQTQDFSAKGYDKHGNEKAGLTFTWWADSKAGTIDQTGRLTAGATAGTYKQSVKATADAISGTADVTVILGAVHTVEITPPAANLKVRGTQQFLAKAKDSSGQEIPGLSFTWSVAGDCGSIDQAGKLTAGDKPGDYSKCVRAEASGKTGTADVKVTVGSLARIGVSPDRASLKPKATQQFTAKGYDVADNEIGGLTFTWTLVQAGAGGLSSTGFFTAGTKAGTYDKAIKVQVSGNATVSGFATVVVEPDAIVKVEVSPTSASVKVGGKKQFTAKALDQYGNQVPSAGFTWSLPGGGGAVDGSGMFTAGTKAGSFELQATAGGKSAKASISVTPGDLATVQVSPSSAKLRINDTQQFKATGLDSHGNQVSGLTFVWSVAAGGGTINGTTGLFTAGTKPGLFKDTVKATAGTKSGTSTVEVLVGALAKVQVSPASKTLQAAGTAQFTAKGVDSAGNEISGLTFHWAVVAGGGTIDQGSGFFTAGTKVGDFKDTVQAESGGIKGVGSVKVTPGAVDTVTLAPASATLAPKKTVTFKATANDAHGNEITGATVKWSVANGGGTITTAGLFAAGTKVGEYKDTVVAEIGGKKAMGTVSIVPGSLDSVKIDPISVTVKVGESAQFTAKALDAHGNELTNAKLVWSVVAGGGTIDQSGKLTAVTKPGVHKDTVKVASGGKSATATVEVLAGAAVRLAVDPAKATVIVGGTATFKAVGYDKYDNPVPRTATWSVTAGGGTIVASGLFTAGTKAGEYKETVKAMVDGGAVAGGLEAKATVVVAAGPLAKVIVAPAKAILLKGQSQTFAATGQDRHGNDKPGLKFTWWADSKAGTIDQAGKLTAGTTAGDFTGAVKATSGGVSGTADVKIIAGAVATVVVSPASPSLTVRQVRAFTAKAKDSTGHEISGLSFSWTADAACGKIDQNGLFTAGDKPGSFSKCVSATASGKTGTADVTVTVGPLASIAVDPPKATIKPGGTQQFKAKGQDVAGNEVKGLTLVWTLIQGAKGTLSATGLFTAGTKAGSQVDVVEVRSKTSATIVGKASVVVEPGAVETVKLTPDKVSLKVGASQQFKATVSDKHGNEVTGSKLVWSLPSGGGTIDATGAFVAGGKIGDYSVSVTAGGKIGTAAVKILPGALEKIVVTPGSAKMPIEAGQQFKAEGTDGSGNVIPGLTFTWAVVGRGGTIDQKGLFTAGKVPGVYKDTVQARAGGKTGSATVEVVPGKLTRIAISPVRAVVKPGAVEKFTAKGYDPAGNEIPGLTMVWAVTKGGGRINPSNGEFIAGTTAGEFTDTIQASYSGVKGFATVVVQSGAIDKIAVVPAVKEVVIGKDATFRAVATDKYGNEVKGAVFKWSVVNGGGTINSSGLFSAGTKAGEYAQTVQAAADGKSATATVRILPGAVAKVAINPASVTLQVEEVQKFGASAFDSHNNAVKVTGFVWSVTGGSCGKVDAKDGTFSAGTVPGTCQVTATTAGISGAASVVVKPGAVAEVKLTPASAQIPVGGSVTFRGKALDKHGNEILGQVFTWSVVNGGGTVDGSGSFTAGKAAGTFTDTVVAGAGGVKGSATVITTPAALEVVTVTPAKATLTKGQTQKFVARGYDRYNNEIGGLKVAWWADSRAGTIDQQGTLTASQKQGRYSRAVKATTGGKIGYADVEIIQGAVNKVVVSPATASVKVREVHQFEAKALDATGQELKGLSFTWNAKAGCGTVDQRGRFTAGEKPGVYAGCVTATASGKSGSASVTVTVGALKRIEITPKVATLKPGGVQQFKARGLDGSDNELTGLTFVWQLVSTASGTLSKTGLFTASNKVGTYGNAVMVKEASVAGVSALATVVIEAGAVEKVVVTPAKVTLKAGAKTSFTATAEDRFGNRIVGGKVTWSASNGGGSIDQQGVFTAGGKIGLFSDGVKATIGGKAGSASVTVEPGSISKLVITSAKDKVTIGQTLKFQAHGEDAFGNKTQVKVLWSVVNGGGKIDVSGLFTAGGREGKFDDTIQATMSDPPFLTAKAGVTVLKNNPPTITSKPVVTATEGAAYAYVVVATDPDGDPVTYRLLQQPKGMSVHSNSGKIEWVPAFQDVGEHNVAVEATDGRGAALQSYKLKVVFADTDKDGLPDTWETKHWGNLTKVNSAKADFDGDGVSNLDEYKDGTDPKTSNAPGPPSINAPKNGDEVPGLRPRLSVNNATDPDWDKLDYEFEVYSDDKLTTLAAKSGRVREDRNTTAWSVNVDLTENSWYWWRARALDQYGASNWSSVARFLINVKNDPPSKPKLTDPPDKSEVSSAEPTFTVDNASDPEGKELTYTFVVAEDVDFRKKVVTSPKIAEGKKGSTEWRISVKLKENVTYYWRVYATDSERLEGPTTDPFSFSVNSTNDSPTIPKIVEPVDESTVKTATPELKVANSSDPDGDPVKLEFEVDKVNTFDSADVQKSGPKVQDKSGSTSWKLTRALDENTIWYWKVRASDGKAFSKWADAWFFVNSANDPPGTVTIKNPSKGATGQEADLAIVFTTAVDPDREENLTYEVEIARDDGFSDIVVTKDGLAAKKGAKEVTWKVDPALELGGRFWVRVRAVDALKARSDWSDAIDFRVKRGANSPPGKVELVTPANDAKSTQKRPLLVAKMTTDRDGDPVVYTFELYADKELKRKVAEGKDLPDCGKASCVGAKDEACVTDGKLSECRVVTAKPGECKPTACKDAEVCVAGKCSPGVATVGWQVPVDLFSGTFFWRVKACDQQQACGPWSDTRSFEAMARAKPDAGPVADSDKHIPTEIGCDCASTGGAGGGAGLLLLGLALLLGRGLRRRRLG